MEYQFAAGGQLYFQPRLPDGSLGPEEPLGEAGPVTITIETERVFRDGYDLSQMNARATFRKTLSMRERKAFRMLFHGAKTVSAKPSGGPRAKWFNRCRLAHIAKKRRR